MIRGTTPHFTLEVNGIDLSDKTIYVTIEQDETEIDVKNPECEPTESGCTLSFDLTQDQSLMFRSGRASMQIRYIDEEGVAGASGVKTFLVGKVLKEGDIAYE